MKENGNFFVTPKHPPHFVGKLARDRNDCLGRFLFVRDAIRFRSGAGPVQAHRDRQEEGGAWELQHFDISRRLRRYGRGSPASGLVVLLVFLSSGLSSKR